MFRIVKKKNLNASVVLMELEAPYIAAKAEAGQFVIVRAIEEGERIPFTIADYDRNRGTVTIIFQVIGGSTMELAALEEGGSVLDLVGPLGIATEYGDVKNVAVVGGGVGCAIAYPQAKKLFGMGVGVDLIAGFRNKDIVILEDEMKAASNDLFVCTDDGSYGTKGFVTNKLEELITSGRNYDLVIAIGPVMMMKFICDITKKYGIKTIVSLSPIMIDGTGMCGCCRVTVDGRTRYACVEGPDFDGHLVDFDELLRRNSAYKQQEKDHICRLTGGVR